MKTAPVLCTLSFIDCNNLRNLFPTTADQHQSLEELVRSFSPDVISLITEALSTKIESVNGGAEPVSLPPTNLLEHTPKISNTSQKAGLDMVLGENAGLMSAPTSPRSETRPDSILQDLGALLGNFLQSNGK